MKAKYVRRNGRTIPMYDNLELWSDTEEGQDKAVLVIRQGMVNHSLVIDPEINPSQHL